MEQFIGKGEAEAKPQELELTRSQAVYLRKLLDELNLHDIPVADGLYHIDLSSICDERVLAFTGMSDVPTALVVAAGLKKDNDSSTLQARTILVAPTIEGSGLLVDEQTKELYSDSFWIYEEGALRFVNPTKPVRIDCINIMYDTSRSTSVLSSRYDQQKRLHDLTDNKTKTRDVLINAGIPVPKGIVLTEDDEDIRKAIDKFVTDNPSMGGFVAKDFYGAHGHGVIMFDKDERLELESYIWDNINGFGQKILLEERIVPQQNPHLRKLADIEEGEELDYNFRVLVTLDRDHPKVIDAEIRYKEKNNYPVNITLEWEDQQARALLIEALGDKEQVDRIYKVAEKATQAVCRDVLEEDERAVGFAGVDLMIDEENNIYVIEVNAGAPVGGVGTLTRLTGNPLSSVGDVLIPAWMESINSQIRSPHRGKLTRLEYNRNDYLDLLQIYFAAEKYQDAEKILLILGYEFEDQEFITENLIYCGSKTGNYLPVLRYLDKALQQEPDDKFFLAKKKKLFDHISSMKFKLANP